MRVVCDPDPARFSRTDELVWFGEPTGWSLEAILEALPPRGRFALESEEPDADPAAYAAVWGVYDLQVTVPGPLDTLRTIPVPGLTWVGVHPDDRRRGAATMLLGDHFTRSRDEGASIVALHASEPTIYGRHGYGVASRETRLTLTTGTTLVAPALEDEAQATRLHFMSLADPGVPERLHAIAAGCAPSQLGAVLRPVETYRRFSRESPASLRGNEPERALIAVRGGQDVGFAWFRRAAKWENSLPAGTVKVHEMAGDAASELALARRLVSFDLTTRCVFSARGVDDRIPLWNGPNRTITGAPVDSLWIRLVDLPKALMSRGYAGPCDLVLRVPQDPPCPWNTGTWRFIVDDSGTANVVAADGDPDLTIDVQTLAAGYLGDGRFGPRLDAGLLTQHRPGAAAALERAFATVSRPIAAVGF